MADPIQSLIAREQHTFQTRVSRAGSSWLLSVGLVFFLATLLFFGGLFFYKQSLESTIADWQEQISIQESELKPELLNQLVDLSDSMAAARVILANHIFASNTFLFLEETTHPKVQFSSYSFSHDGRKLDLSGVAGSYQTVAEQVRALEAHPQVEKVDFGGLSRGERSLVSFRLSLVFKPSLLRFRSGTSPSTESPGDGLPDEESRGRE